METYGIISSFISLAANIALALAYFLNLSKIKKELKEVKVVVNNTTELREALKKPLEGIWRVEGQFHLFKGEEMSHNSSGYIFFSWDHVNSRYEVVDVYSVRKENDATDTVTVYCHGFGNVLKDEPISNKNPLNLHMKIESNSSTHEKINFIMRSTHCETTQNGKINRLEFIFNYKETKGVISFIK